MDSLTRRIARLGLAVCGGAAMVWSAAAAPAMWRVSDDDSAIWLFGSVHILDAGVNWRTPAFNEVFANADEVHFELVLDEAGIATLGRLAIERGFLPPGQTLRTLLTKDENKRLDRALEKVGLNRMMVDPMQPWMAALTISTTALEQSGAAGDASFASGIESQLQAELPAERVRGLETPAEQFDFLSTGTPEEQAAALMKAIDELEASNEAFGGLIEAWEAGDIETIHDEIVASVGSTESEEYQTLIAGRNERWSVAAADLLSNDVDALIVVGAAHLAGPDGLQELLEDQGFSVERIDSGP